MNKEQLVKDLVEYRNYHFSGVKNHVKFLAFSMVIVILNTTKDKE